MDYEPEMPPVHAGGHAARRTLRQFFRTPSRAVDLQQLADFLQYAPGSQKDSRPGPPEEQMRQALSGIRFRRAEPEPALAESALLDSLIAQSDHQNQLTCRFLSLLQ